eukprot:47829-Chlamydomonas_euryale.AAC.2
MPLKTADVACCRRLYPSASAEGGGGGQSQREKGRAIENLEVGRLAGNTCQRRASRTGRQPKAPFSPLLRRLCSPLSFLTASPFPSQLDRSTGIGASFLPCPLLPSQLDRSTGIGVSFLPFPSSPLSLIGASTQGDQNPKPLTLTPIRHCWHQHDACVPRRHGARVPHLSGGLVVAVHLAAGSHQQVPPTRRDRRHPVAIRHRGRQRQLLIAAALAPSKRAHCAVPRPGVERRLRHA